MRIGRLVLTALAIEGLAVLILVLVVAVFGPPEPDAARAYAERMGLWVGPAAGVLLCFGGGWISTRGLPRHHIRHGLLLGGLVAALDLGILVASGAPFRWLFVLSNTGRMAGGAGGGWIAARAHGKRAGGGPEA